MKYIFTSKFHSYFFPNLFAVVMLAITRFFVQDGTLVFAEFIILPIIMGMIHVWFLRKGEQSSRSTLNRTLILSLTVIVLSAVFFGEGAICLIIVSPLLYVFIWLGIKIGEEIFKRNNTTLNVSVFAALFVVFIADSLSEHRYENKVSDELVINAPPDKVWKNVVSFERIKGENKYWLFKIGMPSPVEATVTGHYLGAGRKCIFSNGYVFDEKIVTYDVNENLTFDVTHQPRDPEIMGHIDILRGQFILKDNGDGTTTLTGNSWYRLYVFPTWYYDLWAKSITRNVHWRVMEHIKELSEK